MRKPSSPCDDSESRLPVDRCRTLLGPLAAGQSDARIEQIRDEFYRLASCAVDVYLDEARRPAESVNWVFLCPEDREAFEERVAIMQFDGRLPAGYAARTVARRYARRPSQVQ